MTSMTRTKYAVTFTNARGETREIMVELTEEEEHDCARHALSHRCPDGRWPPLENRYAGNRAAALVPAEFAERVPDVECIDLH
jgi:hypothetical protein